MHDFGEITNGGFDKKNDEKWELISPESNDDTDNEDNEDDEQGKDGEHHQHSGIQLVVMVLTSRLLFGSYLATWQSMFTLSNYD